MIQVDKDSNSMGGSIELRRQGDGATSALHNSPQRWFPSSFLVTLQGFPGQHFKAGEAPSLQADQHK